MNREHLRHKFQEQTEISWQNSQGEPDIEYVLWLEDQILGIRKFEGKQIKMEFGREGK